ncbi:hypothetical protein GCM10009662_04020 [Catellatospora coxensis]|uniref:Uncharacterized protein n=1 Tax=Catellatospora coxensis TaxID=310354 RepID=A0A8J3KZ60_9ACTN|nr:hypothetical protein Cco03nite_14650 [Catellatospora coxensis]
MQLLSIEVVSDDLYYVTFRKDAEDIRVQLEVDRLADGMPRVAFEPYLPSLGFDGDPRPLYALGIALRVARESLRGESQ